MCLRITKKILTKIQNYDETKNTQNNCPRPHGYGGRECVGEYTIKVAKGTATYSNIVFVDGKLTVTKAPLTISGGTYTMVQGEQLPHLHLRSAHHHTSDRY